MLGIVIKAGSIKMPSQTYGPWRETDFLFDQRKHFQNILALLQQDAIAIKPTTVNL
jgi:hypothetical protein